MNASALNIPEVPITLALTQDTYSRFCAQAQAISMTPIQLLQIMIHGCKQSAEKNGIPAPLPEDLHYTYVSVSLPKYLHDDLQQFAGNNKTSVSALALQTLNVYLARTPKPDMIPPVPTPAPAPVLATPVADPQFDALRIKSMGRKFKL